MHRKILTAAVLAGAFSMALTTASAQIFARPIAVRPPVAGGAKGTINLPYNMQTDQGRWLIYQNGWFRPQNGGQEPISQGAMLTINGNQPSQQNNQGRIDEKTGELVIENMIGPGYTVTRRMLACPQGGMRIIDIVKNTQGQELTANIMVQTSLNYGNQGGQGVQDPRKKDQMLGWVATTPINVSVAEMFSGHGSKSPASVNSPQGNNVIQGSWNLTIPAGKEVAIMHLHQVVPTLDAGSKWMSSISESKLMADLPAALRKLIINFRAGNAFIGDLEVLRGDVLDVVELRGGDQMRGAIKEPKYTLKTSYGTVELPAERVVGLLNVGQFRPHQLLVTRDGEIFGGELEKRDLAIELSSGQLASIPLEQLARAGYRKRSDEPEEWKFEKPMVALRSGERIEVQAPQTPIEVLTRFGSIKLDPQKIANVLFQDEDRTVHTICLSDGSRFSGLVANGLFELKLAGGEQTVKFATPTLARLQMNGKEVETEDMAPTLSLVGEDVLTGLLSGQLKLQTAFSTITVNAAEIRSLVHLKSSDQDVQVTLWDQSSFSGKLEEAEVTCSLKCGVELKVPVALVEEYNQPRPQASAGVRKSIEKLAADLSAEDWNVRNAAQERLVSMGSVVLGVLKDLRAQQPAEGQQRIDQIIEKIEKAEKGPVAPPPAVQPGFGEEGMIINGAVDVFQKD